MSRRFADVWGARVALLLTLVTCGVIGLPTPYIVGALGLFLFVWKAIDGSLWSVYREPAPLSFVAVFIGIGVCFSISAQKPGDVLLVFNFAMLLLSAPYYAALAARSRPDASRVVAQLALCGTLLCLAIAVIAEMLFQLGRGGWGAIGVIVLSNTAILLGFIGLMGIGADHGRRRWLYALGPLAGVAVAFITQSRGPLLGVVPLSLVAAVAIARWLKLKPLTIVAALLVVVAAIGTAVLLAGDRIGRLPSVLQSIVGGGEVADRTTAIRLDVYRAAWRAFLEAPLFGHGWAHLMQSVIPFTTDPESPKLGQLHNDVADFAVAAGVAGVLLYAALIAIPIVAALASPRDRQRGFRLFGAAMLSAGYVFAGLTDLMFGFEFHTALYAMLTAILIGYCRDASLNPPSPSPAAGRPAPR